MNNNNPERKSFGPGATPDMALRFAAAEGSLDDVKAALAAGASVDSCSSIGETALLIAAFANPRPEVARHLVEQGANLLVVNEDSESVLHAFSKRGWADLVEKAITSGCNVNAMTKNLETPFFLASTNETAGRADTIKTLIRHGATPIRTSPTGYQSMDIYCVEVLDAALEAGLDINATAENGNTLLMLSLSKDDDPGLTHAFIQRGADVHKIAKHGDTALSTAALAGATGSFACLLDAGAKPKCKTSDGDTFEDILELCADDIKVVLLAFQSRQVLRTARPKRPASAV